jgi:UDP-N-acetylmuramate--alanine ligase
MFLPGHFLFAPSHRIHFIGIGGIGMSGIADPFDDGVCGVGLPGATGVARIAQTHPGRMNHPA